MQLLGLLLPLVGPDYFTCNSWFNYKVFFQKGEICTWTITLKSNFISSWLPLFREIETLVLLILIWPLFYFVFFMLNFSLILCLIRALIVFYLLCTALWSTVLFLTRLTNKIGLDWNIAFITFMQIQLPHHCHPVVNLCTACKRNTNGYSGLQIKFKEKTNETARFYCILMS